ncbi:MAG: hypothetical protein OCD02_04800 [Spirochaetaceae bacterium]
MSYIEFRKVDKKVDELVDSGMYKEAIALLEIGFEKCPEYKIDIYNFIADCYDLLGDNEKLYSMLLEGTERGYYLPLQSSIWDKAKKFEGFSEIEKKNEVIKKRYIKECKLKYEILTPKGYSTEKEYPLFIALHGDGFLCNIDTFKQQWEPEHMLNEGFIVMYIQSSIPYCYNGFCWNKDIKQSTKEIMECYRVVTTEYSVNINSVLLGGFSGGAMASLRYLMNDIFPIKGIIGLSPSRIPETTEENIKNISSKDVKIVIMEGELSGKQEYQEELISVFNKYNIKNRYIKIPGVSHQIPDDFPELNDMIKYIMS